MKINRDSYSLIALMSVVTLAVIFLDLIFVNAKYVSYPLTCLLLIFLFFVIWFHRVPSRRRAGSSSLVASMADGKVVILERAVEKEYLKCECIQVSVYMNFFDVHTNFWPITGTVTYYKYHPGKNILAFRPKSSILNEHATTAIESEHGTIVFRQIAGAFARRIATYSEVGGHVSAGEECGIIKFGSRVDLFLPPDANIKVKLGDLTRACETVIAELK